MPIYICQQCGGSLTVLGGEHVFTCEYCGAKQTIKREILELPENYAINEKQKESYEYWESKLEYIERLLLLAEYDNVIKEVMDGLKVYNGAYSDMFNHYQHYFTSGRPYEMPIPFSVLIALLMAQLKVNTIDKLKAFSDSKLLMTNHNYRYFLDHIELFSNFYRFEKEKVDMLISLKGVAFDNHDNDVKKQIIEILDSERTNDFGDWRRAMILLKDFNNVNSEYHILHDQVCERVYKDALIEEVCGEAEGASDLYKLIISYRDAHERLNKCTDSIERNRSFYHSCPGYEPETINVFDVQERVSKLHVELEKCGSFEFSKKKELKKEIERLDIAIEDYGLRCEAEKFTRDMNYTKEKLTILERLFAEDIDILKNKLDTEAFLDRKKKKDILKSIADKERELKKWEEYYKRSIGAYSEAIKKLEDQMKKPATEHKQISIPYIEKPVF